ncbi:MAG: alpha/beta fold hydrolase [Robiginitomaculum sp.]
MGSQAVEVKDVSEELIDMAYSMAIEPERFRALFDVLERHISSPEHESFERSLEQVSPHFDRASHMMDRQERRFNYATGSRRYIDEDSRPAALISSEGVILHSNDICAEQLGLTEGDKLSAERFEHGDYARISTDLKALASHKTDKVISIYTAYAGDDHTPMKVALSKTTDFNGKTIGRLSTFHVKWSSSVEQAFQDSFNLTSVEMDITRAVVSGQKLSQLAEQRRRSLATLRKQMKVLLAKMNLRSQVELACVYSGFTQFTLGRGSQAVMAKPLVTPYSQSYDLTLKDGRNLHYEISGPETGRPVLYCHSMFGGAMVTPQMGEQLRKRNIKLITPWRPYFAKTSPDKGPIVEGPQRFARDVEALLIHLGIKRCQILGQTSGAIYAYHCAAHLGDKISAIVNVGGVIPIITKAQFSAMSHQTSRSIRLARHAPGLMPIAIRSILARIDAGYDEEFSLDYFDSCPADFAMVKRPIFQAYVRHVYPLMTRQGHHFMTRDIIVQASKWGAILERVNCPVTLVHGAQDTAYTIASIESFAKGHEGFSCIAVKDAGQLVLYQEPRRAFESLC